MTTFTDKELIKEIKERIGGLDVRDNIERRAYEIALASLEAEPVAVNDDMAYAFHHALSDSSLGADEVEEIKAGLRAAFANVTIQPEPVVPDEIEPDDSNTFDYVDGWNACRAAMLHSAEPVSQAYKLNALDGNSPVTPGRLPGGFTIEDAKELHENLVRSHISQALSGEKMKKKDRDADLRWIHGVIVQAAWFVKASLGQNA
ncbi:dTDP-6-deoxy-L-hexose 3-O-methyltransferase [Escherichia coli]|nr:dTDP-6-deoxy-L-hexose 3-O-methyltransferase [Escherichia coli]MDY9576800.1 dTDP-6-deoxy-L-hexose 3-O-methyltransferase [Escherichia coli]